MSWGDLFFWPVRSALDALTILVGVLIFFFVVLMIVDCFQRKFKVEAEKWIWIALMIFTTWAGALLYYVFIKNMNKKGVAAKK